MNSEEFKHHCSRLGWPPPFAAKQFGRSTKTGYAWAAGTRRIPATVASFMETYTDPITKPQEHTKQAPSITPAHLLAFRRHFALSQLQAASLIGVTRVTWNRWERSKSTVPAHLIHTLKAVVQQLKEIKKWNT
jgi:DNA-binding transcriptional regulator YiaG